MSRSRSAVLAGAVMLGGAGLLSACGSTATPSASALGTPREQACTAIADVLSDGPDAAADPVGYAEAQPLPLRRLRLDEPRLRAPVEALASAFQAYSATGGATVANKARVSKAEGDINAICPGAAP